MPGEIARWAVEPLHRARRGFDERLLVVTPWLAPAAVARAARARRGSRLRRFVFSYGLRVGVAQVERRDYELLSVFLSPHVELHLFPDAPEDRPVDARSVYRGRSAYAEVAGIFQADFENFRWELRELIDAGGDRVGGRMDRSGKGGHSGVMVRDTDFYIWQFERGLLRRQFVFRSESAMLAMLESTHSSPIAGARQEQ